MYKKDPKAASGINLPKPSNKKITFADSDSESDSDSGCSGEKGEKDEQKEAAQSETDVQNSEEKSETVASTQEDKHLDTPKNGEKESEQNEESLPKKARVENEKPIDELINEELKEMGDRKKVSFFQKSIANSSFSLLYLFRIAVLVADTSAWTDTMQIC